jgi:peptide/nickel transport system substrate-binding protein
VVTSPHGKRSAAPSACGCGYNNCRTPDECNEGDRTPGGSINVGVRDVSANWNVGSEDSGDDTATIEAPILPSVFTFLPSGNIVYNADLLATAPQVVSQRPMQVVYRLKPTAVWNDGDGHPHPVNAQDFVYAWQTFNGHDRKLRVGGTDGYELISNVAGSDGDETVTVTFDQPYVDWKGLFADLQPYWFVALAGGTDPADAADLTDSQLELAFEALTFAPRFSAGPFMVSAAPTGGPAVEVPNPLWYGADQPTLDKITFRAVPAADDLSALRQREIDAFAGDADPDTITALSNMQGVNYAVQGGFRAENLVFNSDQWFMPDEHLREAVMDAIDVQQIIDRTVKPTFPDVAPLYSHNLVPGETGYADVTRQTDPVEGTGDLASAERILTAAGYTGVGRPGGLRSPAGDPVTVTLTHTNTAVRDGSAALIVADIARLGIKVINRVIPDPASAMGDYFSDIWETDLDVGPLTGRLAAEWETGAGNNFTEWGDYRSDALLKQAMATLDDAPRANLVNQQDAILTAAHVDLPLYRAPHLFVAAAQFINIRDNTSGGLFTYNTQDWGLLKS